MSNNGGWKQTARSWKDYSHEKIYGAIPNDFVLRPFSQDTSGVPVVFQGSTFNCVPCTVTWIKQFKDKLNGNLTELSHEFLAAVSNTAADGATPNQVLEAARKIGICDSERWLKSNKKLSLELELAAAQFKIVGYAYLQSLSPTSIAHAIVLHNAIMIGVDSYMGSEPHMMAGVGVEERDGVWGVKTINWWKKETQDEGWVAFSDIKFAATILNEKPTGNVTLPKMHVLASKWSFLSPFKKWAIKLLTLILASTGVFTFQTPTETPQFGAAGVYDVYSVSVAGAGVDSDDTFLPVSSFSLEDGSGESVTTSTIRLPAYITVNPRGTNREVFECNALSSAQVRFTNCYRAISCNNLTNTTSTIAGGASQHAAGEPVILSNNNCFFQRFTDTFTNQYVAGIKQFTATSVHIGDNTTTTGKQLIFRVGLGENTYIKFTGPSVGNTTATALLNLGAGEFALNASGTTVGASSTGAVVLTGGVLGVHVSGTSPIHIDSTNKLYLAVSSTASQNGGLIDVFQDAADGIYKLAWKTATFLSTAWTVTGNWIFQGNVTSTGTFRVPTPTSTQDVANKGYVDINVSYGTATGTAGTTISAGQPLYVSTTGTLFVTNAASVASTYGFVGIAKASATVGQEVSYVKPGGIADFMTGLSAGRQYFLADSAGGIGVSPGTIPARIGVALSSTRLQVNEPSYRGRKSGSGSGFNGAEADAITTGFVPTAVYLDCAPDQDAQSIGWWKLNGQGTSSTLSIGGDDDAAPYLKSPTATGIVCKWEETTNDFTAWVATTTNGFIINSNGAAARTYYWTAEYDPDIVSY